MNRTTDIPELAPSHPLRSFFTRYGWAASRNVGTTLLISVAVATLLIYPLPFLYTTDFTNAASNLPHHVWTDGQPLGKANIEPDVIMRSIWVHGSYMRALNKDVLLGALDLQDRLLGPTTDFNPRRGKRVRVPEKAALADLSPLQRDSFHVVNGLTSQSWFFHSPLQYWSCDAENIANDSDILVTVNARKTQPTSVNVTLRHSIVFSGKRFEDRQLVAADALVVTLIHLRDSPVGRQWERRARQLAFEATDKWTLYPSDGESMPSQLYEFQFRPISRSDTVSLALAYLLTIGYFLMSLAKLRALKSKAGLIVTVIAQIIVSILSSFTVCAILKIDLSRIPHFAYPLVSLAMTTENVFRVINAVMLTPSENSISSRIGHAFGETGHVALASVAQNMLILWGLSKVVFPGVSAFCTFAAIAIFFDFFYLSTFFLSVLSVDIRRAELSDAISKAHKRSHGALRASSMGFQSRTTWTEAIFRGRLGLSTRIAVTFVIVGFVLIAQWHFFENETLLRTFGRIYKVFSAHKQPPGPDSLLVDIHQARSPTSWLRLQDHETAREVINVVKPWSHSYVARVYDPLVFVMKGADRTPPSVEGRLLPAVYDFARHQLTPFLVIVLFIVAAVRLLMNFLLFDELAGQDDSHGESGSRISIRSLNAGHILDIAMLAASPEGHIVSVGLDRLVRVWDVKSGGRSYIVDDPDNPIDDPFPILSIAIDDNSNWMALLSSYRVLLWNLREKRWGPSVPVDLLGQRPEAFFFGYDAREPINPIFIVRRNGTMSIVRPDTSSYSDHAICRQPLVSAKPLFERPSNRHPARVRVLTASRKGCIHVATETLSKDWESESEVPAIETKDPISLIPLSALSLFLIVRSRTVDLVDAETQDIIYTFVTEPIQPRSLHCLHSSRRRTNDGKAGLAWFTLAYVHADTNELVLDTYLPAGESTTICIYERAPRLGVERQENGCTPWTQTEKARKTIPSPGAWEVLSNGTVVGVRRINAFVNVAAASAANGHISPAPGLRRRGAMSPRPTDVLRDTWEVWMAPSVGNPERLRPDTGTNATSTAATAKHDDGLRPTLVTVPLLDQDEVQGHSHLFTATLGPMVKVGGTSVAVGLGNIIKVITVGSEHFSRTAQDDSLAKDPIAGRRRRLGASGSRSRAPPWT